MKTKTLSVWEQCQAAGAMLLQASASAVRDPEQAVASHFGWSLAKTRTRLLIYFRISTEVIELAGAGDDELCSLSLARLLDAARRRDVWERAICLSFSLRGRRPYWADAPEGVYVADESAADVEVGA